MTELMPAAIAVLPDEKAYGLSEVNLLSPWVVGVGQTMHRYQIIYVNRDDKLAEYREDLGSASGFSAIQFRIPSFWEHTVGELKDIAEDLRNRPPSHLDEIIPKPNRESFWQRYTDLQEAKRKKGRMQ